jgi:hypothetical protein
MLRRTTAVMLALAMTTVAAAGAAARFTQDAPTAVDLKGKLYRAVFVSGAGMLGAADVAALPEPLKGRLTTFLARRTAFKSSYKSEPDALEKVRADAKRRDLERSIVAMIDAPGIEKAAAEFVAAAPIAYEWEGMHGGPLAEAAYAEGILSNTPSSPLAPWLSVFIAQRQRIAFETYENEKDDAGMKAAAAKYRTFAERARTSPDPIYPALVDDMDRLPFLYLKSARNPRDYR